MDGHRGLAHQNQRSSGFEEVLIRNLLISPPHCHVFLGRVLQVLYEFVGIGGLWSFSFSLTLTTGALILSILLLNFLEKFCFKTSKALKTAFSFLYKRSISF